MSQENLPIEHLYFTESSLEQILENLDVVRNKIHPQISEEEDTAVEKVFPSVCLIGLGRCGSNIALDVASLVYDAKTSYMREVESQEILESESEFRPMKWIRKHLPLDDKDGFKPVFLIEPIVMLGDLDKDIEGRIRFSNQGSRTKFLEEYKKLQFMDLSEVHAGGAGNAPILGQYLAKMILNKDATTFINERWKEQHSYLVDSCGIKANQSRLYFYIFSAGGGTGSGMASEFGLAQQFSYLSKTFDYRSDKSQIIDKRHSFVFEPIFTSGICILPNVSGKGVEISEALHINAGRLLTKYISEEWNFSYNGENREEDSEGAMQRIRPWNSMMLISNDIMRYAEEENGGDADNIDVNTMEKYANQYISQQIFNILTAQAVTTDYDEDYFRRAGIDISDTIRLDANDLFMSLAGPVAVAYSESVVSEGMNQEIVDIDDLFCRSIELPHFNNDTLAIEGVSVLPVESERYREAIRNYRKSGYDPEALSNLHFFKNCSSIVSIISLPRDYKLSFTALNRLKMHLNRLCPNTTLKRYALVIGASANLSLTTLIAKSPCLSDDFLTLMVSYMKRCFARDEYRYTDEIDNAIVKMIQEDDFDESLLDEYFNTHENPAKILDTNWYAIKPMYEKKYRELMDDRRFVSINDIRLDIKNVKNAIKYLREIYRHRISKTGVLTLNN